MKTMYKQIHLSEFINNFDDLIDTKKPLLLELFERYIDVNSFIPHSFYSKYYSSTGHPRVYSLSSMISAFIFMNLFSLPTVSVLISVLSISNELREACGFSSIPNKSQFSRFTSVFYDEINLVFHRLVDITQPICNEIDSFKSSILISDTTGFEGFVKENNPKFFNTILNACKSYAKKSKHDNFDIYKFAGSKMPKLASSNSDIKLSYSNGHYGYYIKSNIVTNGLGIVRHIDFYEPIIDSEKSFSIKSLKDKYDSKTLIPVLERFFYLHTNFKYKYFLGDSGFDSYDNCKYLYKDKNITPIIPINPRNSSDLPQPNINNDGVPTCPHNSNLPMKFDGITKEKGRADRIKYLCPKSKKTRINGRTAYILSCDNPCTTSSCGRIKQIAIDSDYRLNCPIPRNGKRWKSLYKIRTVCERAIAQLKSLICIEASKLQKTISIKSRILFAGITQLVGLIILYKTNNIDHPRAIKSIAM